MNIWIVSIGLLLLVIVSVRLAWHLARDGLGSNPPPRSHHEELGSRADRELRR
jgi:cytochrome b561